MSDEKCNADVYQYGETVGVYAMSAVDAEKFCKDATESTGCLHDWHSFGGRVVVKALPKGWTKPESIEELKARISDLERRNGELEKEAARYRFLRRWVGHDKNGVYIPFGKMDQTARFAMDGNTDASIDAAITRTKEHSNG